MKFNIYLQVLIFSIIISMPSFAGIRKILSPDMTFPFVKGTTSLKGVSRNTLYFTFDDGPTSVATPYILDALDTFGVKATFFVVGRMARNNRSILDEIRGQGHRLANHSYSHEFDFPSQSHFINSLIGTHELIDSYVFRRDTLLFRAPGGIWNDWREVVGNGNPQLRKYVGPIYWNVGGGNPNRRDDADWKCWNKGVSVDSCKNSYMKQIYSNYRNGRASIILLHDINRKSSKMLYKILQELSNDSVNWKYDLIENIPAVKEMN